jgi:hypothetical protein
MHGNLQLMKYTPCQHSLTTEAMRAPLPAGFILVKHPGCSHMHAHAFLQSQASRAQRSRRVLCSSQMS